MIKCALHKYSSLLHNDEFMASQFSLQFCDLYFCLLVARELILTGNAGH